MGRTLLRNPVMPASGTFGFGLEYGSFGDLADLGAVVVKSISAEPWAGNPAPRIAPLDVPGSLINSVGLPNPGVVEWAKTSLPQLLDRGVRVVASIWGHTPEDLISAARLMSNVSGPVAWELNLSCPNLSTSDALPSHNPDVALEVCRAIRTLAPQSVGLWAKLAPNAENIVEIATACRDAQMDAVTMTNTYPGLKIDANTRRPALGAGGGGMSGAILKPFVLPQVRAVHVVHPELPIVAAGGVLCVDDALEYLDAGATAIQVGTANFLDPRATFKIACGVVRALHERAEQT